MFIYSNSGEFESYIAFDFKAIEILPLPNGNYLMKKKVIIPESKYIRQALISGLDGSLFSFSQIKN
jgi:hypothetical protein